MKRILIFVAVLLISSGPLGAKGGAAPLRIPGTEGPIVTALAKTTDGHSAPIPASAYASLAAAKGLTASSLSEETTKGGGTCNELDPDVITCDSSANGFLQATDCALTDGTVVDFWVFNASAGDQVIIDMSSDEFDTFLFLLDTVPAVVSLDDDSGGGTNAQITWDIDQTGVWSIAANNFEALPGDPGNYTLQLQCNDGGMLPPNAPSDLSATVVSPTEVDLFWQDNSNDEDDFEVELAVAEGFFQPLGTVPADSAGAAVSELDPETTYNFRVRARNAAGNSDWSNVATATTVDSSTCTSSATATCLNGGRFLVHIEWLDFGGVDGTGSVVPVNSDDSGLFYFFSPDNWEMLVKVLDGCAINNRYWVFGAATTTVEYTLTVTDTQTGFVKQYTNPLGAASVAITDTDAFATCP